MDLHHLVIGSVLAVVSCGCSRTPEGQSTAQASSAVSLPATPTANPESDARKVASCDSRGSLGSCMEYGPKWIAKGEAAMKRQCTLPEDVFTWKACPTGDGLLGTCNTTYGYKTLYYAVPKAVYATVETAKKSCEEDKNHTWQ